jgi:hypothetical protein
MARPERPYRGIFGRPVGDSDHRLTLEATFGAGWNWRGVGEDNPAQSGSGTGSGAGKTSAASTSLVYSLSRKRIGFNASNAFYTDYYPDYSDHKMQTRDIATSAFYFVPAESTRVTVTQGFKNLPEFSQSDLFDPDLLEVVPLNQDFGLTVDRFKRFGTSVEVTHKLAKRSTVDLSVGYAHGTITSGKKWTTRQFEGDVTHRITKGVDVYVGYAYGEQIYTDLVVSNVRDKHPTMRFGVDFNRALSISRRTTLSFSTGVAQVHDRAQNTTTYHLIGAAGLKREFGRTWDAGLFYSRNVRYIEAFALPLLNDSVGVAVHGSFSRRVQFQSSIGASSGQLGASGGNSFDTRYGSVQLSVGMTRHLGFGTDYSYARLPSVGNTLRPDPLAQMNGQSIRAHLQLWVPLLSQTKRP